MYMYILDIPLSVNTLTFENSRRPHNAVHVFLSISPLPAAGTLSLQGVSHLFDRRSVIQRVRNKTNKNLVNIFVPTTPNPTSGFLLMFPKEDVIYLNMSFEEASKFIVSAGTSNPKN